MIGVEETAGVLAMAEAVDPEATEREGDEEEQAAPVCDDEADAEPGGLPGPGPGLCLTSEPSDLGSVQSTVERSRERL